MPPKGKAKAGAKAKADAKAKAAEPSKPAPTATPSEPSEPSELPATPAAGSGTAAVRQQREVAATPEPRTEPESHSVEPVDAQTVAAEPVDDTQLVVPSRSKESTVDLATIADPWAEVSDELAMARIKEEDWEVIEAENEAAAACQLNAKDTEMQKFQPKDDQRRWLVAADFSENQLTSVEALGGPMWLRHLNLGMNPMESLNGLSSAFPRLLVLDVSFIELPSVAGAWQALAELSKLRRLVAEGCSLCSFEDWEELPSLKTLEVNDNAIEELEELEILAKKCKGLLELDFRENEVAEKPGYAKKIAKFFPNLTWLDNQSRKKYVAKGADATYSADALKEKDVTAVDGMFKNESCSCLEGNPCLDRATCKDWANREKVAAEARKRKGLRDDSGKML
mmetsp:Transcript_27524/g.59889  ORF Transcript_27524/g.59889 Transcript_27524/m.59889 type:complete len:396 (-) Transcript_27524:134-1321(-)